MILSDEKLLNIIKKYQVQFKDRNYTKYLQDKRVILVGPDDRLIGQNKGGIIGDHDVIIRLNTTYDYIPFKKHLIRDIGKRTDVLYLSPTPLKTIVSNPILLKRKLIKNHIHFINYQNGNNNNIYDQTSKYCYPKEKEKFKQLLVKESKIKTQLHYSHESCKILSELLTKLGGENLVARTGFLAIWDTLLHGAKSIRVEGMSFYHGGGHMFRKVEGDLDPYKDHRKRKSPHNSVVEIDLFKRIIRLFPGKFIIGDSNLAKILEDKDD